MSCVISYVLLSFLSLLRELIPIINRLPDTAIINSALCCIFGTILCILIALVYNNKYFKKLTVTLFHKTPFNDIWHDVIDFSNGSNLKVYIRDKDYYIIGHHFAHEEKGNDSWLAVSAFAKYDVETNLPYKDEPSFLDDRNVKLTIRLSDVEHIEIF